MSQGAAVQKAKKVIFFVILGIIVNFVIQNSYPVSLQFLFWRISMPGILFYPLLLVIGFTGGWLACWLWTRKKNN